MGSYFGRPLKYRPFYNLRPFSRPLRSTERTALFHSTRLKQFSSPLAEY